MIAAWADFKGGYLIEKAAALRAYSFDRVALGRRGQPYKRLDQLVIELLLGLRLVWVKLE